MDVLGPGQKPIVMPSYPHMMSEDIAVWSNYLADPVIPIKEVWYDVHVGGAIEVAGGPGTLEYQVAAGISRKRIDVIAQIGGGLWVIEIKPFGSMLAFGQVLSYYRLFIEEHEPACEVLPVIVCYEVDPDVLPLLDDVGVGAIEVGRPEGLSGL